MDARPMVLRSWWMLALRGVLLLLFGGLALAMPGPTVLGLVAIFAVYALLAGVIYLAGTWRHRRHATGTHAVDWWLLLLVGLVSVGAGVVAVMQPLLAALVLVIVIGVNAMVSGVLDIILAVRLRNHLRGGAWLLLAGGLVSLVVGTVLVTLPGMGVLALAWLVGAYAIVAGVLYLMLAYRAYAPAPGRAAKPGHDERRMGERRTAPASQH
ncbi:HdeD family acid-resistance protein [Rugamonas sp. FT107W]|uniref:HdeD family acid-resistance protein n=1 Tax=Duganella vulcania TaxID=2692166 RepID=A0A845HIN8_9BURK|nr:DUF308 domain-containing protein [Duganella vulcania]MYN18237.1 HdeD family acid-resistance protein [Duganella vulcania]